MRPNRRAQDRDEAQPVAPASYLDAPHSEKVFCKIKDMNNANAATAERNLPSCILGTLKREGRLSPSLANVCWLGGLDSNQDSQIQSLESYQLDDLPAGRNKKESQHLPGDRDSRDSTLLIE